MMIEVEVRWLQLRPLRRLRMLVVRWLNNVRGNYRWRVKKKMMIALHTEGGVAFVGGRGGGCFKSNIGDWIVGN